MRDWCRGCGGTYAEDDVQWMAGIPYHPHCAQREMDFMDAADAHFRALGARSIDARDGEKDV